MALLTLEQVATELGLKSEQSVRNLINRGELRVVRLKITGAGGRPRIESDDLEAYRAKLRAAAGGRRVKQREPIRRLPPGQRRIVHHFK